MSEETIAYAPFSEHFAEFRKLLVQVLAAIGVGILLCVLFYRPLFALLTLPLEESYQASGLHEEHYQTVRLVNYADAAQRFTLPDNALPPSFLSSEIRILAPGQYELPPQAEIIYLKRIVPALLLLGPLEGMAAVLKISGYGGIILSSPVWLFFLARFLLPGLKKREKGLVRPFMVLSFSFIALGILFAFFVTAPLANAALLSWNHSLGTNAWTLHHYLDFTLFLLLANGIAFQLFVVGIFAVKLKIVSAKTLAAKRRHAIVAACVLGALLTPPDVLSQLLLAVPLAGLYELLILYARLITKHSALQKSSQTL
jgi:sec-independent protein translocase protein TatC